MYPQQIINGTVYIDGGVVNNLPVEPLRERCQTVVGISLKKFAQFNQVLVIQVDNIVYM